MIYQYPTRAPVPMQGYGESPATWMASTAFQVIEIGSVAACAYHGYKRNNSVGWAIGWAIVGGLFPVISVAIALAEGFGKPAKR